MPLRMTLDDVSLRPTTITDLDRVIQMEREDENAGFIRQWSADKHKSAISDDGMAHLVIESVSDARILGYVILLGLDDPDGNIEFKRIVVEEKGKGYGRKAVRLVKKFAFEKLNCHRLWLEVMENNQRAYELYESEGFIPEGVHRESLKKGNKYFSLKVMSILAQEYGKS
jgi:diamine N-acetyltransferase